MMKLSDYVDINPKTQLPKGVQVPFVGMDAITAGRRKVTANERREAKGSGAKFLPGDTLFARITPCLENGKIAQFSDKDAGLGSTEFFVLRAKPNVSNQDFVFYFALQKELRDAAEKSMTGASGRQRADASALKEFECEFPSLPIQRHIAGILSAYDELIENNQRRIRILEEMARSLYREWFVHFRYPGHDSPRPQAGEGLGVRAGFVDSPLGQIPQGWEVKKIAELLAKVSRQGKIKTQDYLQTGDLPVIDQGRELVGGYTNDADVEYSGELPVIVFGDHTRILKFIDFPFACGADGTQLLRSNDERMPVSLFYYTLSVIELSDFAYARHFKFLKEELVVVPIAEAATAFSERVNPIKRQVRVLQQQSDNLRHTRDLLLPRLLSGQIALATDTPPIYDEDEFKRMVEKGTQAWAGVPDSAAWVETLRGNKE